MYIHVCCRFLAAMATTLNIPSKSWCEMRKSIRSMKAQRRYSEWSSPGSGWRWLKTICEKKGCGDTESAVSGACHILRSLCSSTSFVVVEQLRKSVVCVVWFYSESSLVSLSHLYGKIFWEVLNQGSHGGILSHNNLLVYCNYFFSALTLKKEAQIMQLITTCLYTNLDMLTFCFVLCIMWYFRLINKTDILVNYTSCTRLCICKHMKLVLHPDVFMWALNLNTRLS